MAMKHLELPSLGLLMHLHSVHTYMPAYLHTYMHACMHACMHADRYIYIYMYVYVYIYNYIHTCMRMCIIYTYIYICMYTHRRGRPETRTDGQALGPKVAERMLGMVSGQDT